VATGRVNGTAHVRVANTGPRVPADAVERLTQPFERLGRSADGHGAGLGLSIVRAVARAHGGEVRASARDEGGLTVTVTLPHFAGPVPTALSEDA
jgi:signal transduction histidine kinase